MPPTVRVSKSDEYRQNYRVMHIGMGPLREELYQKWIALADKLGVKESTLVHYAMDTVLKDPPTELPEEFTQERSRTGTASGFWTVPIRGADGTAKDFKVIEVLSRKDVKNGQTFFRYDQDDNAARNRARKQAVRAAEYMQGLLLGTAKANKKEVKITNLSDVVEQEDA